MKTLKILTIAAIIIAASAFAVNNVFEEGEASNSSENGYEVGDVATDFKLKNIDGKQVSLSDYSTAKGFIVVFTTNHCPYAKAYESRIVALDKKYKTKGYPVIAINPNNPDKNKQDSFENMKLRAKQKGFTFPYLLDEGQKIYPQYGATKTPHVYILEKENKELIVKYIGAIDDNYQDVNAVEEKFVENAIDELLAGEEVSVKTTKAIGCSIK
ncbi:thioredoxin family protein [Mesonia sp.]|uniref:thioredoxin family protein n=1 Tax=Mesonia sp. TaxID=1960830 RepID=UPI0017760AB7|nr:thioredoxin family protein [Mesonia sp.]HIB36125.1 thioredoxin family protein [Mesonia sp.]HIO27983.1 thioredoxin family protein [Flavobacteriaceae bacterium]